MKHHSYYTTSFINRYLSHKEAIEEIQYIANPVVAAKRLQDLAQGYGCKENVSVLVLQFNCNMMSSAPSMASIASSTVAPPVTSTNNGCNNGSNAYVRHSIYCDSNHFNHVPLDSDFIDFQWLRYPCAKEKADTRSAHPQAKGRLTPSPSIAIELETNAAKNLGEIRVKYRYVL